MIKYFFLQANIDSAQLGKVIAASPSTNFYWSNYWIWIVILELIIIGTLLLILRKRRSHIFLLKKEISVLTEKLVEAQTPQQPVDVFEEAKNAQIDFGGLMNDINKSKKLYEELVKKFHPDRFTDPEKNRIANEIVMEIGRNRTKYSKLLELKTKAEMLLN